MTQPLFIGPYELGIKQNLKPFMIPDQAFSNLKNCFVFRGRVIRKSGYTTLGQLARAFTSQSIGTVSNVSGPYSLFTLLGITDPNATLRPGFTISVPLGTPQTLTDLGTGTLSISPAVPTQITGATVNYLTGVLTLVWGGAGSATATFTGGYFPQLPAMGIRTYINPNSTILNNYIFFDTKYAYTFSGGSFSELPSTLKTTWSGQDYQQFWSTNFQTDTNNNPLFWATNNNPGLQGYTFTNATNANPMIVTTTNPAPNLHIGDTVYVFNANVAGFNFLQGAITNVSGSTITTNIDASAVSGGIG